MYHFPTNYLLRLLKFILNYTSGRDVIILLRLDNKSNHSVYRMLWCLTNEKSNFAIAVARYEISYGIYNKLTRHSVIPSTCVGSICLYLATLFPRSLAFLIGRKAPSFISKANMSWERGCVFSYTVKIELRSLTEVSHVKKKKKVDE